MAKQLTGKQLDLYDAMRKKVMAVRRKMIRRRREIENTQGGRMQSLPALVIPKRPPNRLYIMNRPDPWRAYHKYLAMMKESLSATREVRRNYFIAWRDMLGKHGVTFTKGRISSIDMNNIVDDDLKNMAHLYNEMFNLAYGKNGLQRFLDRYERGGIVQLRWIYNELEGMTIAGTFSEEQRELNRVMREMEMRGKGQDLSTSTTYKRDKIKNKR